MTIVEQPIGTLLTGDARTITDDLLHAAEALQGLDLDARSPTQVLELVRVTEVVRRRLDHATDRIAGHVHRSGAYALDGHRTAKAAIKHLGRLSGADAHARLRTARALRRLPAVDAAARDGRIPSASMRAIARSTSNPRVADHLPVADPVIASMAATLSHDEFVAWLREWERLADADGAAQDAEFAHERRTVSMVENAIDGTWTLRGTFGAIQGAAVNEVLEQFTRAETEAGWAAARAEHGAAAVADHLARTLTQRRTDAMVEAFRRAAAAPADARTPKPLVNLVIDQQTFEDEVRRASGQTVDDDPFRAGRRSQTINGSPIPPADVVAAALVGHVRRVVVDAQSNVIDLGRRRRLFTGASRDAALLQGLLRGRSGLRCGWPCCDVMAWWLQCDHRQPVARGGPTDIANAEPLCGTHNRLKERGFVPVRGPDGAWTILRPDGQPITPSV